MNRLFSLALAIGLALTMAVGLSPAFASNNMNYDLSSFAAGAAVHDTQTFDLASTTDSMTLFAIPSAVDDSIALVASFECPRTDEAATRAGGYCEQWAVKKSLATVPGTPCGLGDPHWPCCKYD